MDQKTVTQYLTTGVPSEKAYNEPLVSLSEKTKEERQIFTLEAECQTPYGTARAGTVQLAHGEVPTPIFMPVGTQGTVKCLWAEDLEEMDTSIILGNTYHLYLRPGADVIQRAGGLHEFMSWKRPILTDSGGFQVFSLSSLNKMSKDGVTFKSHWNGSYHFISPDDSMAIQRALGSDIVMSFDECPALPATRESLEKSLAITLAWLKKCRDFPLRQRQQLFAIVQGGLDLELRKRCLAEMVEDDFPGYAIGGLSVGEKNEEMLELLTNLLPHMPKNRPRYLMGVGTPLDVLRGIERGVDMFDCVLPTRNARNGQFLTRHGPLNIKNERFKEDSLPPDPTCDCRVCTRYERRYIRHLMNVGEYLAGQMISYHNIYFYKRLVTEARAAILQQTFDEFSRSFYNDYQSQLWQSSQNLQKR
jgi:queuine tRNA-ribosyltransferase